MSDIDVKIVQYGPVRVVGMNYIGKNENQEIPHLWDKEDGFLSRMHEISGIAQKGVAYGICRCISGVTDGSFEYIAGLPVEADAPIPDGMTEAMIQNGIYAIFTVNSLAELSDMFEKAGAWVEAQTEWVGCCGKDSCDCENHPWFELYPDTFGADGKLYLYAPIRSK